MFQKLSNLFLEISKNNIGNFHFVYKYLNILKIKIDSIINYTRINYI